MRSLKIIKALRNVCRCPIVSFLHLHDESVNAEGQTVLNISSPWPTPRPIRCDKHGNVLEGPSRFCPNCEHEERVKDIPS